ncbi:MAG: hypothetical protein ACO1Q7_04020 [Gemmatimonas sp.]
MTDFRPSPALLAAVTESLAILKRHYSSQMRLALDISPDGLAFTSDYCRALAGIDTQCIIAAGSAWIDRVERFAPKPGELAKVARELERQVKAGTIDQQTMSSYTGPKPVHFSDDEKRANQVVRQMRDRLENHFKSSYMLAGEAWEFLLRSARHEDQVAAFKAGNIPPYLIDEAVAHVRKAHGLPEAA